MEKGTTERSTIRGAGESSVYQERVGRETVVCHSSWFPRCVGTRGRVDWDLDLDWTGLCQESKSSRRKSGQVSSQVFGGGQQLREPVKVEGR